MRTAVGLGVAIVVLIAGAWAQTRPSGSGSKPANKAALGPITSKQADAILQELRAIRQILERQPSSDAIANELRLLRQAMERQQPPSVAGAAAPPQAPPPSANKVKFRVGKGPAMGAKDAPLVLVEFSDYQCPFCRAFHTAAFQELKKNFIDQGKLSFLNRDLPLDFHNNALKMAQAARCADEQNKFWEMRDLLIQNAANLAADTIVGYAQRLSLDMNGFKSCVAGDKYIQEIREQASEAGALGISGTPSFVLGKINGEQLEGVLLIGAQSYSYFDAQIKEQLSSGASR